VDRGTCFRIELPPQPDQTLRNAHVG
jgi:hypothetical protein